MSPAPMKLRLALAAALAAVTLSACSTTYGPAFVDSEQVTSDTGAVVYIYRPPSRFADERTPEVLVDGVEVGALPVAGYVVTVVPVGVHKVGVEFTSFLEFDMPDTETTSIFIAGETYFYRYRWSSGPARLPRTGASGLDFDVSGSVRFGEVDEALAAQEISELRRANPE